MRWEKTPFKSWLQKHKVKIIILAVVTLLHFIFGLTILDALNIIEFL